MGLQSVIATQLVTGCIWFFSGQASSHRHPVKLAVSSDLQHMHAIFCGSQFGFILGLGRQCSLAEM